MFGISLRKLAAAIFVLQVSLIVADAQAVVVRDPVEEADLNTTSNIEDYIIQNQRQYAAVILNFSAQIIAFKESYLDQLSAIQVQTDLLEARLVEVDTNLNPLELLSQLSKHCVQKYRSQIATVASVKSSLNSCVVSATNALSGLITNVLTTSRNLETYYSSSLKTYLANCQKTHAASQLNYTICVTQTISSANTNTINYQKTFNTQLSEAKCSAGSRIKTALDCSFSIYFKTISVIGETTRLIDNCIAGLEYCPPCVTLPTNSSGPSCANVLDLSLNKNDYRNATIRNPFYGLNNNSTCLHINILLTEGSSNQIN